MFFRKSGLVSGFTTIRKCASACDGIEALHTDGKALQKKIGFALVSDRWNATSQLQEKLRTFNIYHLLMFLGTYWQLLLFLYDVSTLTFCINVLHRLILNGCVLSPMFENKRRYNTIQYNTSCEGLLVCFI